MQTSIILEEITHDMPLQEHGLHKPDSKIAMTPTYSMCRLNPLGIQTQSHRYDFDVLPDNVIEREPFHTSHLSSRTVFIRKKFSSSHAGKCTSYL